MVFDPTKLTLIKDESKNTRKIPEVFKQGIDEIAAPIGEVIWAWNYCHSAFHRLFAAVVNPHEIGIGYALWHAVPSDSAQREMLMLAAGPALLEKPKIFSKVVWAKKQADKLSTVRNDVVHMATAVQPHLNKTSLVVDELSTAPKRSRRLKERDVKKLLSPLRGDLIALANYVSLLQFAYERPERFPLPRRPRLLSTQESRQPSKKKRRHKNRSD